MFACVVKRRDRLKALQNKKTKTLKKMPRQKSNFIYTFKMASFKVNINLQLNQNFGYRLGLDKIDF
ncbi:hypothetical protein BpHYR1_050627 [Brachionus plicatilis]|uniref:Uncharacterized protein n=1 Tax=Brachionus plicatilis TaxID=10195 RepID=A0A3M7P923_BRAPC|nr:hypothetical protein BpHYR1_050627 [Brachionus plicatilis]